MPGRPARRKTGPRRLLTLHEAARRAGTHPATVDAYQRHGLLPPPQLIGSQPYYGVRVLRQLALLALAEGSGIEFADLAHVVPADEPSAQVARQRWEQLAQRRLEELRGTSAAEAVQGCLECRCMNLSRCPLIVSVLRRRPRTVTDGR